MLTGGLAPIGRPVDDVYGATYVRLIDKHRRYFERYPEDRARVDEIHRRLDGEDVRLPGGDRLTSRRFRQLGMWLGDSAGFELLHHVLELPFGSRAFLADVEGGARFERNPIYATLHESSYADGGATRWSADRLMPDEVRDGRLFTAEHVFPWMFEDYAGLRSHRGGGGDPGRARVAPDVRRGSATNATMCLSRRPSIPTTCTWSGRSRKRPRPRSGVFGPGSRTSTSTTRFAPTASASWTA